MKIDVEGEIADVFIYILTMCRIMNINLLQALKDKEEKNVIGSGNKIMNELLTIKNIIIYLIVINLIGFLVMFLDKQKAKKEQWRISEKTIFVITLIGGGIGTITGMYKFRHKTKKLKFTIGLPTIVIFQISMIIYFTIFRK